MPGRPQLTSGYDRHAIAWTQVCQVPPLPTRQRYNRRSTARKLSLRAVVVSGGGVRSDQIADHNRLGCPAASQFDEMHRDI